MSVLHLKCECPHCKVNIEFPSELSGQEHKCPECGLMVRLLTSIETSPSSPAIRKRSKGAGRSRGKLESLEGVHGVLDQLPTEKQLRRLAAHGRLDDRHYTRAEASRIISTLSGEPDWQLADTQNPIVRRIRKRDLAAALQQATAFRAESGGKLKPEDAEDLETLIEEMDSDLQDIKEEAEDERETAKQDREDERMLVSYYQDELGADGQWGRFIRRPTQEQVRKCLTALNRQHPNWEEQKGLEPLVATLMENFPALKKTQPRSSGCLLLIVLLSCVLLAAAALASYA